VPAINGYLGAVYVKSAATSTAFVDLPMTVQADNKTCIINDSTKRYWDTSQPVVVETSTDGIDWAVATGYTVQHCGGRIIFNTALTAGTQVQVSASAYTVTEVASMYNWELEIEQEQEETTGFGSGWTELTPTLRTFTGSCEWYLADGRFSQYVGDKEYVFVLYVNENSNKRYEFYGILTNSNIEVPVDGIVTESLDFSGKGQVYYRED
jgi:hypothetical protein